jgi:hypothetical protein
MRMDVLVASVDVLSRGHCRKLPMLVAYLGEVAIPGVLVRGWDDPVMTASRHGPGEERHGE